MNDAVAIVITLMTAWVCFIAAILWVLYGRI